MIELSFDLTVAFSCVARRELFDSATLTPDRPGACSPCDPAPISTSSPNVAASILPSFASCSSSSNPTSACLFDESLMFVSLAVSAPGGPCVATSCMAVLSGESASDANLALLLGCALPSCSMLLLGLSATGTCDADIILLAVKASRRFCSSSSLVLPSLVFDIWSCSRCLHSVEWLGPIFSQRFSHPGQPGVFPYWAINLLVTYILLHTSSVTVRGTISLMRTRTGSWLTLSSCTLSWSSCPCGSNAHSAMSSGMASSSTRGFGLLGVPFTSRMLVPLHFSSSGSILMVLALTTPPDVPMRASFVLRRMPNQIPSRSLSNLHLSRLFVLSGR